MMKREHGFLIAILAAAALWRVWHFSDPHELWWDAGVYVGMGKFLFSGGAAGLWEHIRPVGWPAVLGLLWSLGLDPVVWGRLLEVLLSMGTGWLLYDLTRAYFDARTALFATVMFLFSPIMGFLGFHLYTEIPAVFSVLLALWFLQRKRPVLCGVLAGAAFLVKFPAGLILAVIMTAVLLRRAWRQAAFVFAGFLIPVTPYLAANAAYAGSMLGPLQDASQVIRQVLGCNVLHAQPWWHYFGVLITSELWGVHALALVGLLAWRRKALIPALGLGMFLAYFMFLPCREYRYLVLFLPFVCMFSGRGLSMALSWSERKRVLFPLALIALLLLGAYATSSFYSRDEAPLQQEGFAYLAGRNIDGELWTANPLVAIYSDAPLRKIYYPLYHKGASADFLAYVRENSERIGAVFLDNCGGGMTCAGARCEEETRQSIALLEERFTLAYEAHRGKCWHYVFEKPTSLS